jgi:hypothetical protein
MKRSKKECIVGSGIKHETLQAEVEAVVAIEIEEECMSEELLSRLLFLDCCLGRHNIPVDL